MLQRLLSGKGQKHRKPKSNSSTKNPRLSPHHQVTRSIIVGRSNSGKTTLAMYLFRRLAGSLKRLIIVSPSIESQPTYAPLLRFPNKKYFFPDLSYETLEKIDDLLEKSKEPTLLYIDDVTASRNLNDLDKGLLSKFAFNARWLNMHIMCCTHKITGVSASLRENADHIYLFNVNRFREREIAHNEFGADFVRKKFMDLYTKAVSKPHGFLYIHRGDKNTYRIGL